MGGGGGGPQFHCLSRPASNDSSVIRCSYDDLWEGVGVGEPLLYAPVVSWFVFECVWGELEGSIVFTGLGGFLCGVLFGGGRNRWCRQVRRKVCKEGGGGGGGAHRGAIAKDAVRQRPKLTVRGGLWLCGGVWGGGGGGGPRLHQLQPFVYRPSARSGGVWVGLVGGGGGGQRWTRTFGNARGGVFGGGGGGGGGREC